MAYNFSGEPTGPQAQGGLQMQKRESVERQQIAVEECGAGGRVIATRPAEACLRWTPCDLELWKICHLAQNRCVSWPVPHPLSAAADHHRPSSTGKPGFGSSSFFEISNG
jgi:hypothetical protein